MQDGKLETAGAAAVPNSQHVSHRPVVFSRKERIFEQSENCIDRASRSFLDL